MPTITIYNDSDADLDADFDVIEIIGGKEKSRETLPPDKGDGYGPHHFRLWASNQCFLIVPRGTPCPRMPKIKRSRQIDAKLREAK
jgi:hypothetical protein